MSIFEIYRRIYNDEYFDFDMTKGKPVVMKKINWGSYINLIEKDKGTIRRIMFTQKKENQYLEWLNSFNDVIRGKYSSKK